MDKVRGGTPRGGSESMCKSCRNAQIVKGVNNQENIFCNGRSHSPRVNFPVVECSLYDDKSQSSLHQMYEIAWRVESRNRGPVGFAGDRKAEIVIEPPNRYPQESPAQPGPNV